MHTLCLESSVEQCRKQYRYFCDCARFARAVVLSAQIEVWDKEAVGNDKMIGGITTSFMGWIGKGSFDGDLDLKDDKVRATVR